jgi:ATP-dependent RNA helicase SUPV3L1/SUV3
MRRLRENSTLETDISKTGEVVVEGHAIGRLDGFVFTPAASAAGTDAKALAGAAQKALAGEIDARAARLGKGSDDQFVLAADGTVRWLGQAVGKLAAGEEVLKPRLRLIADEQLTGAPRDLVQARLDLWLKAHIEKLLGPLVQLAASEEVTGIARGVAFQLVERLGVLDRRKVAEEVKGLDQPARATLRKFGVRFGAYNIYIPPLLKPAPRGLALQLWALKQAGRETTGLEAVERLAASGRTSIAADKEIDSALYAVAGYRLCGERAVRVDMLERLADIIRPAIAWREGAPGVKPAAAFDGTGCFTVVVGMTSLVGCAGEDFAAILRSLGYRMEKRPKPPPLQAPKVDATVAPAAAETATASGAEAAAGEAPASEAPAEAAPEMVASPCAEEIDAASPQGESQGSAEQVVSPAPVGAPEDAALVASPEVSSEAVAVVEPALDVPAAIDATIAQPGAEPGAMAEPPEPAGTESAPAAEIEGKPEAVVEEPQLVEVWRAGRPEGQRRHRRPPRRAEARGRSAERQATPANAPAAAEAGPAGDVAASAGEGAATEAPREDRRPRRHRPRRPEGDEARRDRPGPARPDRAERGERGERERPERRPRAERGDRPDRDPELRAKYFKGRAGDKERRDKAPDPNSPFAKLAALKEQLEANAKERH